MMKDDEEDENGNILVKPNEITDHPLKDKPNYHPLQHKEQPQISRGTTQSRQVSTVCIVDKSA